MLSLLLRKVAEYKSLGYYSSYKHCMFFFCHVCNLAKMGSSSLRLSVKLIETTLLGRKRKAPSSCTTTKTSPCNTGQATSSASVLEDDDSAPSTKKSKSQKLRRPGHQRHRPETKAKIDLFKKIRSSAKLATEIKRSPEELKLWDLFKSGKCLTE